MFNSDDFILKFRFILNLLKDDLIDDTVIYNYDDVKKIIDNTQ